MRSRRSGVITALLLTAVLFAAMPGVVRSCLPKDTNRMDERLRPSRLRMMTVWLIPGVMDDTALIRQLCAQFEKEHDGVRIFLRTARAEELYGEGAVLPDAVLFDTGSVTDPEGVFLPLAGEGHASGLWGGVRYAQPLWMDVNVLCMPRELSWEERVQQPVKVPAGTALQQLQLMCPQPLRSRLTLGDGGAEVRTLRRHMRLKDGFFSQPMTPAVSDRVRYMALCRDGEDARAFLLFLSHAAQAEQEHFALVSDEEVITLPNAFAHSREGLESLCLHAFESGLDPVETLLRLR